MTLDELGRLPTNLVDQLLANSVDGLIAFDDQCRYTFWNRGMERILGMQAFDVMGQRAFDLFPFLVDTGEDELWRRALAGEATTSSDRFFAVAATGKRGYYDAYYFPLYGGAGEVVGGMGIIRDVTDRRTAQIALEETETRFKNMADVAPVLLWMSGTDGLCTFFNQTWLRFTGRSLEDEWGVGWAEGVHFEDLQKCLDTYMDAFNARRPFEVEYRLRRHDGEYRWILDRGTPRYGPGGMFAGFIGSCVDITELKELQQELQAAVRMRDEFLSIASHELRTPLTAAQLQTDILIRKLTAGSKGPSAAVDALLAKTKLVQAQIIRLTELVQVLLDVSRITAGKLTLSTQDFDLSALVADIARRFEPEAAKVGCAVELFVEYPVWGSWDPLRLDQVVTNLLSNALKYAPGAPVRVAVSADDGHARLAVADQGMGIAPEAQVRIFERFERAVPATNYGGLGLGLWIAREIVEAHGGSIKVESARGQGATFTIELPLSHGHVSHR
ncbi:MAG: PAS domain-containing sensor histidine kinase [Polyangiaceae bacterium]|nr:PAS domain-containing sensor histidine kinase [Polyangiaceae bacterium]